MTRAEPAAEGLADLTALDESTLVALRDLLGATAASVPGARACVLTLSSTHGHTSLSSSDEETDGRELAEGDEALLTSPVAGEGGARASVSFLLETPGAALDPSLIAHATGRVSGFLDAAMIVADRDAVIAQLGTAVEGRTVIGQAMGVLMAQSDCSADVAMEALKRQSDHPNHKLREVAAAPITAHESAIGDPASSSAPTRQAPGPTHREQNRVRETSKGSAPKAVAEPSTRVAQEAADPTSQPGGAATEDGILVLHRGGPHAGRLRRIATSAAQRALVYERELAVYRPESPPHLVNTTEGPAQVWVYH